MICLLRWACMLTRNRLGCRAYYATIGCKSVTRAWRASAEQIGVFPIMCMAERVEQRPVELAGVENHLVVVHPPHGGEWDFEFAPVLDVDDDVVVGDRAHRADAFLALGEERHEALLDRLVHRSSGWRLVMVAHCSRHPAV